MEVLWRPPLVGDALPRTDFFLELVKGESRLPFLRVPEDEFFLAADFDDLVEVMEVLESLL